MHYVEKKTVFKIFIQVAFERAIADHAISYS